MYFKYHSYFRAITVNQRKYLFKNQISLNCNVAFGVNYISLQTQWNCNPNFCTLRKTALSNEINIIDQRKHGICNWLT